MLILGLAGGFNTPSYYCGGHFIGGMHDASCVLLRDGQIVAAIEEERLNRIKHTCYFPERSIEFCLEKGGITLSDVDWFAWGYNKGIEKWEKAFVRLIAEGRFGNPECASAVSRRIVSIDHHIAHAMSSYALSGFDDSLIYVIDGSWGGRAGLVMNADGGRIEVLQTFSQEQSLGLFYSNFLHTLGFRSFDQYKVMGLAPYGDPSRFRAMFGQHYSLLADGNYRLDRNSCLKEFRRSLAAQDSDTKIACDVAATLQEILELVQFHVLRHYQARTKKRRLCLAGGVAQNCSANGKLLRSGLFEEIYVPSAPHDGGLSVGAAYMTYYEQAGFRKPSTSCSSVYWGSDTGEGSLIAKELESWSQLLIFRHSEDIFRETANAIAEGAVIGWVQGRSEFGPRALGNRSILADPRPAANKDRINAMIKKREAFRPFAPAVAEDRASEFFEIPDGAGALPFMAFTVIVRENKRQLLGAITHVDGTARVQTVSREINPAFYDLLTKFGESTGIPVLLNTSFNSNIEPIVESIYDAITCYLTTGLDFLVIGNYWIKRRSNLDPTAYLDFAVEIPEHIQIMEMKGSNSSGGLISHYAIRDRYYMEAGNIASQPWTEETHKYQKEISPEMYRLLTHSNLGIAARDLLSKSEVAQNAEMLPTLAAELFTLWSRRFIVLAPCRRDKL